jgi:hypothetical protein
MLRTELIAPIGVLPKRHAARRPDKAAFRDARDGNAHLIDQIPRTGSGKIMQLQAARAARRMSDAVQGRGFRASLASRCAM